MREYCQGSPGELLSGAGSCGWGLKLDCASDQRLRQTNTPASETTASIRFLAVKAPSHITETLTFEADREGEGTGQIRGTMAFDRKDFELGGSISFVRIADRVELTIDFKATRVRGPPLLFKQ